MFCLMVVCTKCLLPKPYDDVYLAYSYHCHGGGLQHAILISGERR